jgi:alpha-L-glutamate ligase-like protein
MIFKAARRLREAGVLGMNRRNAEYIMNYNARSAFPLVDNKVLTKELAGRYGIPTPPLYHLIRCHGDMKALDRNLEGKREFALKPARGSGGNGIILVTDRVKGGYVRQSGKVVTEEELFYHISGILSGIYSLEGLEDIAIIEGLIHPDPIFSAITHKGVPDIRIVVCRGVPVMAMTRLPTRASDGKANLHAGALGAGIDIAEGVTLTAVHGSSVVTHHPDTGNPVAGIKVPFWEEMLLVAARTFDMTVLGYLGVDLVIDRQRGPLLLELNARPGLQIQVANGSGLRSRLEQVESAPAGIFADAEKRVAWARRTFSDRSMSDVVPTERIGQPETRPAADIQGAHEDGRHAREESLEVLA